MSSAQGVFPSGQANSEPGFRKGDQERRDQDGAFHTVAPLSRFRIGMVQHDVRRKQFLEEYEIVDGTGRVHPAHGSVADLCVHAGRIRGVATPAQDQAVAERKVGFTGIDAGHLVGCGHRCEGLRVAITLRSATAGDARRNRARDHAPSSRESGDALSLLQVSGGNSGATREMLRAISAISSPRPAASMSRAIAWAANIAERRR